MLTITIQVEAPAGTAQGVKEDLTTYLERFGDARVVEVREWAPQQMDLWTRNGKGEKSRTCPTSR